MGVNMNKKENIWLRRRSRISEIIEVGSTYDWMSRGYDILSTIMLLVNISATVMYTFNEMEYRFGPLLLFLESFTVAFFAIDYALRVWTARFAHPEVGEAQAIKKYMLSFTGIVDLLSFLPHYLPVFFPAGAAVFRMFRVIRIFRLFQVNAYYDSLNVITQVISSKRQQLMSSVFIILVLMLASSLCMYSLENKAQPEVFSNAFSGIWWSVSTLLTVGYGDIYPITDLGKAVGIVISFLGVGMVAIPTGIISAGFVDQYSRIKRISEYGNEEELHFVKTQLGKNDKWVNKQLREIDLPHGIIVALVRRGRENIVPRGDVTLKIGDTVILAAESVKDDKHIELKEMELSRNNPWVGRRIEELDISRQTFIVMVKRRGNALVPRGGLKFMEGDHVILYTQQRISDSREIIV